MTSIMVQAGTLLRRLSSMPVDIPLRNFESRIGRLSSSDERLSGLSRWDANGLVPVPTNPYWPSVEGSANSRQP